MKRSGWALMNGPVNQPSEWHLFTHVDVPAGKMPKWEALCGWIVCSDRFTVLDAPTHTDQGREAICKRCEREQRPQPPKA